LAQRKQLDRHGQLAKNGRLLTDRGNFRCNHIDMSLAASLTRRVSIRLALAFVYNHSIHAHVIGEITDMSRPIVIELEMPGDLKQFRLPKGVNRRLQDLLDKQSRDGKLSRAEREEAEGLVNLAEMLSLLRLRAERAAR
jgi:hypothetical protein